MSTRSIDVICQYAVGLLLAALLLLLVTRPVQAQAKVTSIELHNVTTGTAFCGGGTILTGSLRLQGSSASVAAPLNWTIRRINISQNTGPFDIAVSGTAADLGLLIVTSASTGGMGPLDPGDIIEVFVFWDDDPAIQSVHYFVNCQAPGGAAVDASLSAAPGANDNGNGLVDPGEDMQIQARIVAGGEGASSASLSIALDAQVALHSLSIRSTPIARDDSYEAIGNVGLQLAAPGLLANDNDPDGRPGLRALPVTAASTSGGGEVTLSPDGGLSYAPAAGFRGTDSFVYIIEDADGNRDQATVRITVSGIVWFVDNSAPLNGDGRFATPFNSLAAFNAVNDGIGGHPAAGDRIFIHEGGSSYSGGVALLNGQQLIGQGVDLVVLGQTVTTATSRPLLANAGGNGISLAQNNTIRGLRVSASGGAALSGTNFGLCTMNSLSISASGHPALSLQNGTLNATCGTVSSAGSSGRGLSLINVNGNFSATGGSISAAAGTAMFISQGSADIRYDGTIVNDAGRALEISSRSGGAVVLNGAINDDDPDGALNTGILLQNNNSGSPRIQFNGDVNIVNSAGTALTISNNSGAIIAFADFDIDNSGSNQSGLNASGGGTLNCSSGSIDAGAATALAIDGMTTDGVTLASVRATNTGSNGIDLTNNTGLFRFDGVDISVNAATALNAVDSGMLIVSGANNSLVGTQATVLRIVNTDISSPGVTFRSVSCTNASQAIVLQNAGSGGFSISGTGAVDGSGGILRNIGIAGITIENCTGISLRNMQLIDANTIDGGAAGVCDGNVNTGCNAAIQLNNVDNISLNNVDIDDTEEIGINGRNITDFDLRDCRIENCGNAVDEHGIFIDGLFGTEVDGNTNSFVNSTLRSANHHNVLIINKTASYSNSTDDDRKDKLVVTDCTFADLYDPNGANGLFFQARNTSNMRLEVSNSIFRDNRGVGINVQAEQGGKNDLFLAASTFTSTKTGATESPGQDVGTFCIASNTSEIQFEIVNNTSWKCRNSHYFRAIGFDDAVLKGRVGGNTMTGGTGFGHGIEVVIEGDGDGKVLIDSNTVEHTGFGRGISLQSRGGSGSLHATVTSNSVNLNNGFNPSYGLFGVAGNGSAGEANTLCMSYADNTVFSSGRPDYYVEQVAGNTFNIQDLVPSSGASTGQIINHIQNANTSGSASVSPAGAGIVVDYTAANCSLP